MESYIAGGVESILLDELSFRPSPGASYILNKTQVRFYPSGSSIYSPTSGQRVCKINLTGPSNMWLNPQSIRMVFDVKNVKAEDHPLPKTICCAARQAKPHRSLDT